MELDDATGNTISGGGWSATNADLPDIQYHFSPTGFEEKRNGFRVTQGFSFHIDLRIPAALSPP